MHDTPEKESAYTALEYRLKVVDLANVQMGRMYRQLKEERDAIQQQLELKESEYQSVIDKVNIATKIAQEYQQQNKQLIEAMEEIRDEEWRLAGEFTTIYTTAYLALQQIQDNGRTNGTMCGEWEGKDDER